MKTFEEAFELTRRVPSGCDKDEHEYWYDLITNKIPEPPDGGPAVIIECGSDAGGGTSTMLQAAVERGWTMDACDCWKTGITVGSICPGDHYATGLLPLYTHIFQMMNLGEKCRNSVRHHIADNMDFFRHWRPSAPVAFAWIDSQKHDHGQADIWMAIKDWVYPGGIIGVHDTNGPDWYQDCVPFLELKGGFAGFKELAPYPHPPFDRPTAEPYRAGWRTRAWVKL